MFSYQYIFFFSFLFCFQCPGDQQGANRQTTTHKKALNDMLADRSWSKPYFLLLLLLLLAFFFVFFFFFLLFVLLFFLFFFFNAESVQAGR